MPATDAFTPASLSTEEKAVLKSYGGWTNFCHSMGLKPYEQEDEDEAKQILAGFAAVNKKREEAAGAAVKK